MTKHIPFRKVDLWLQGFHTIWLSTTRSDGRLHSVPVWYWWDGEGRAVYFTTHQNALKAKNLLGDSRVVIHAGDGDNAIIMEGRAEQVIDGFEQEQINHRWQEKYASANRVSGDLLYRVAVSHVMVWEYGSVNTRTDWQFEPQSEAQHV